jgi:hypothetical protein
MRRAYYTETAVTPGAGVVQGSGETKVKAPGAEGSDDFIGVYAFEANEAKGAGDEIGVAISGIVQALAGGVVNAGKKAVLKGGASGAFIEAPTEAGQYATCANEFNASGRMETYAANRYGLKAFIDEGELHFTDGPFKTWERREVEMPVSKPELAQEKRVADAALNLAWRSAALSGTGTGAGKKWSGASATSGGDWTDVFPSEPAYSARSGLRCA